LGGSSNGRCWYIHKSYGYLVFFMYGEYILWPFGTSYGYLVYFFPFLVHYIKKKSGNPGVKRGSTMAGDSKQWTIWRFNGSAVQIVITTRTTICPGIVESELRIENNF
jgi:hypothetical protein